MIFYTMDIQVTFEFFSILIDCSDIHIFPSLHVVNDPKFLQNPEIAEPISQCTWKIQTSLRCYLHNVTNNTCEDSVHIDYENSGLVFVTYVTLLYISMKK